MQCCLDILEFCKNEQLLIKQKFGPCCVLQHGPFYIVSGIAAGAVASIAGIAALPARLTVERRAVLTAAEAVGGRAAPMSRT